MGSQAGGSDHTPPVDWVAVSIMVLGSIALSLALPFKSWPLGIVGGVLFVVGAGIGLAYGIMDHTEDYEVLPKPAPPAGEHGDASQHTRRILSA